MCFISRVEGVGKLIFMFISRVEGVGKLIVLVFGLVLCNRVCYSILITRVMYGDNWFPILLFYSCYWLFILLLFILLFVLTFILLLILLLLFILLVVILLFIHILIIHTTTIYSIRTTIHTTTTIHILLIHNYMRQMSNIRAQYLFICIVRVVNIW